MNSHLARVVVGILLTGATLGCGGTKVMVPPRIDLQQHEVLAVIEFSSSREGELGPLATARFVDSQGPRYFTGTNICRRTM